MVYPYPETSERGLAKNGDNEELSLYLKSKLGRADMHSKLVLK
jgi:hypothetical protein